MRNRNTKHSSCASRLACQEGFRQHSFAHEKRIPCKSQAHFQAQGISWYFHSISMHSFHKWLTHLWIRTSILMSSPLKQRAIASHSWCLSHPPRSTSHLRPVFGWRCLHPSSNPWGWQRMFHDGTILLVMTFIVIVYTKCPHLYGFFEFIWHVQHRKQRYLECISKYIPVPTQATNRITTKRFAQHR